MSADVALRADSLTKTYGDITALDSFSLDVPRGEVTALLGRNGAGKTTFISIASGLMHPDSGSVTLDGHDIFTSSRATRQRLGVAPQELGIYPTVSVRHNLAFFGRLRGLRGRALDDEVEQVAGALGLLSSLHRAPKTMSGGERRRLHTALALMGRADVLLLDEPTVGVDVETRSDVLGLVKKLATDGAAICYTTHYLAEVEQLDATVAIVDRGSVIAHGRVSDLTAGDDHVVEFRFHPDQVVDGLPGDPVIADGVARWMTSDPATVVAQAMARLSDEAAVVEHIEIVRPGLESCFLRLTGNRYAEQSDNG